MSYKIIDIEGVGEVYAAKLKTANVNTTEDLLQVAGTKKGRIQLAETTGISEKLILTWTNHADLMRIKGIASQFSELLEAAGVDTVKEFATRVPENLHKKLVEVNEAKGLSGTVPSLNALTDMVAQAKTLPQAVFH
ncbi:DUF4332 domain-containing protein [Polluticaenibacter yanchengensis]|uniref:DUF4332 domain-containing protein n=1 Tax=Polluticaenibacter yanchengensis TaxID=3014562 RepID=A0ABT4UJ48_9BACT|nr:DUF4332 domain-containing protein [Chitinophagaceae bacterium LY-5]